jgi:outer membrane protein TolC
MATYLIYVMKKISFAFLLFILAEVAVAGDTQPLKPLTLADCYAGALKTSEAIAIKNEVIKESNARYLKALGTMMPDVSYDLSATRQGVSNTALPSVFASKNSSQFKFTLNQPIFSGFKEFAGISASRAEQRQRLNEEIRARQMLFSEVAGTFFYANEFIEAEKITSEMNGIYTDRIEYLNKRVRVGRSRESEVANTILLLQQNIAQLETIRNQKQDMLHNLEFLTGIENIKSLDYSQSFSTITETADYYMNKVLTRSDVSAAYEAKTIADKLVTIAQADLLPAVDLTDDYFTRRTGGLSGINWDATLSMRIPLLPFVGPLGDRREAQAKADEAGLQYSLLKRSALLDVKNALQDFHSAIVKSAAYKNALDSAERNYRLQKQDYELNLIDNIALLTAIQTLQSARLDYMHSIYEIERLHWNLITAVGENL